MVNWKFFLSVFLLNSVVILQKTSASVLRNVQEDHENEIEIEDLSYTELEELWRQLSQSEHLIKDQKMQNGSSDQGSILHRSKRTIMSLGVSCFACKVGVGILQRNIHMGYSEESIMALIKPFCLLQMSESVCDGVNKLFAPEVIYILKQVDMNPNQICSMIMGDQCHYVKNPAHEWRVIFPFGEKPRLQPLIAPKEGVKTLKVLHLSDTHYDPHYQEGANADCGEPLCCRLSNGVPMMPDGGAGKWGDYRKCDTPKRTIDNMFEHIQEVHPDIDYIIWTGDLPPHDSWNQTKEENRRILRDTVSQMMEAFPNASIFPALGNHESAPVNSFSPPTAPSEYSVSWLYDELDEQWRRWLPPAASNTVKHGAFYSVLVRPGFRIISINTNYCNDKNFWLLINSTDPGNELQWLIDELQGAENRREKVHIIGHIPPGTSDCLKVWSANYYRIINRYESTITAQFFGHTHFDEFELFYDTDDLNRPVSVAYIGPSVTPHEYLNPGYRIYYVDDDEVSATRHVVDHETWIMNLEEANFYDSPVWWRLYSARDAYEMGSLLPSDWNSLVDRMIDEPSMFDVYYKHYHKNSPVRPICDTACRKRLLCDLRNGRSRDRDVFCRSVEDRINKQTLFNWGHFFFSG